MMAGTKDVLREEAEWVWAGTGKNENEGNYRECLEREEKNEEALRKAIF